MSEMLQPALAYHDEGLCVIPIAERDKKPALATWEEYHTRRSTREEIEQWFGNGHLYNIGIVHGEVSGNFISIDIDHDNGFFDMFRHSFIGMAGGRIEQSGSGEGYHIPLRVEELPDFGTDNKQGRPRGNRTWKTEFGSVNLRCRFCQTVVPPSIHPSGNRYRFIQDGEISYVYTLDGLISWLDELDPPKVSNLPPIESKPLRPADSDDLVTEVKGYWDNAIKVFAHFGVVNEVAEDRGELRLLGNGGLLIDGSNHEVWYNFSDEIGGGVFEAWGYMRFGSAYDKHRHFRQVLLEMALAAGIDVTKFYRRGDENRTAANNNNWHWTTQRPVFARLR